MNNKNKKLNTMLKQKRGKISVCGVFFLIILLFNSCTKDETFTKASVDTGQVTSVTEATATCGGSIISDGGATVTTRGVCWSTSQNPTTADSKTTDGAGLGNFSSCLLGLAANTTYYVRAYATNNVGTEYGTQLYFTTYAGSVTDIEGNRYLTIIIGSQTWMVNNLKTKKYNDGTSIPFVSDSTAWSTLTTPGYCFYNNDATNNNKYGALYNWYTVNTNKLAPTGWHVPTFAEWTTLENYLISNGYNYDSTTVDNKIAKSLASKTGWPYSTSKGAIGNDLTKNNTSGFMALPGGYRFDNAEFNYGGFYGFWWSSTEFDSIYAFDLFLYFGNYMLFGDTNMKKNGCSVRCVRDY